MHGAMLSLTRRHPCVRNDPAMRSARVDSRSPWAQIHGTVIAQLLNTCRVETTSACERGRLLSCYCSALTELIVPAESIVALYHAGHYSIAVHVLRLLGFHVFNIDKFVLANNLS